MKKKINISKIRIDGGSQNRSIDDELVTTYKDAIKDGDKFPPIDVTYDGKEYWLYDGFHRYHAYCGLDKKQITANIRNGTKRDSVWLSFGANSKHGRRRKKAENDYILGRVLTDKEWKKKSLRDIAKHVGLSHTTISNYKMSVNKFTGKKDAARPKVKNDTKDTPPDKVEKPTEKTHKIKPRYDKPGNKIPEHLYDVFDGTGIFKQLSEQLGDVLRGVQARVADKDPRFTHLNMARLKADIKNATSILKAATPYSVCAYCGGDGKGCRACKKSGFQTKLDYESATPGGLKK